MNTVNSLKTPSAGDPAKEATRETAALWHDRLNRDKVSEEAQDAFQAWLEQTPEHRAAYAAIESTWDRIQSQPHDPEILALRHEAALRLTRDSSLRRFISLRAAAAVLVVTGAAAGLLAWRSSDLATLQAAAVRIPAQIIEKLRGAEHYVTATGERLTVVLTDGSQVTLNTQSELKVAFEPGERKVTLTRGQALFEVAKDKTRPFVVEAQGRRFIAVGTAFDVRVDGHSIQLTMVEGKVKVEHTAKSARPATTLIAGEQLTIASTESPDAIRKANPERVISWRLGQVIFEDSRLTDAVTELNRYSKAQIRLADPTLGNLRISGAFLTGRPANFVEALVTYFPIQAERHTDGDIVLTARD